MIFWTVSFLKIFNFSNYCLFRNVALQFLKISIFQFLKNKVFEDGLLPARHTEPQWNSLTMDLRRSAISVYIFMFLVIFCIMSYRVVTFRCFISYWNLVFCEYQRPCSIKPFLLWSVGKWYFSFLWKFSRKATEAENQ